MIPQAGYQKAVLYPHFWGIGSIQGTGRDAKGGEDFHLVPLKGTDLGVNSVHVGQDGPGLPA